MTYILVHGLGHKATSWNETISYMDSDNEILCPNLSSILNGKEATYANLYAAFAEYCNKTKGKINLCGLSLGGILTLNYAMDFPDKVNTLVLIGAPHKIPSVMLAVQNIIFRFLPKSFFENMAFSKKDMFIFVKS
ncbi:MAG: alpha/beta hydrolase, partial [Firmicutes bacterium]|nr:alpha/beta hydrolase [Bacillota bacterium]